jgi:YfiH family protein
MPAEAGWLAPDWPVRGVGALMTTRGGGFSAGPYASMNLQAGGGDADAAVQRNRERLAQAAGAAPVYLRQVHGRRVVRIGANDTEPTAKLHEADAAFTTQPGVACTVLVADCLPVLLAAPEGRAVGAAHAGWRGLAAGVLEASVEAICGAARCAPADLQAWLGASIGPERFQVGIDVLEAFGHPAVEPAPGCVTPYDTAASGSSDAAHPARRFVPEREGKWLADLPGLARDRLAALGVSAIGGGRWCTVTESSRFFSYRRDRVTGRMAAAVWIRP